MRLGINSPSLTGSLLLKPRGIAKSIVRLFNFGYGKVMHGLPLLPK